MELTHTVKVTVAGVRILFSSDSEADIYDLTTLFKYHLSDDIGDYYPVEICAATKNDIPSDAKRVWKGYYHGIGKPRDGLHNAVYKYVAADGEKEYFLTDSGECVCNNLARGRTVCTVINKYSMLRHRWERSCIGNIINLLVHIVMARHRRYSLHASAVVWRGRAIVFTGLSGQGKSTICSDLVAQGAGFMGDDIVFLYQEAGVPRVASLLFDAKLFESSTKDKDFIDMLERYHCQKVDSVPLQAIAVIRQTRTGESTVEREADDDKMLSTILIASNNIALQYDREDWMTLCVSVMSLHDLFTFYYGDRKLLKADILNQFYAQE